MSRGIGVSLGKASYLFPKLSRGLVAQVQPTPFVRKKEEPKPFSAKEVIAGNVRFLEAHGWTRARIAKEMELNIHFVRSVCLGYNFQRVPAIKPTFWQEESNA